MRGKDGVKTEHHHHHVFSERVCVCVYLQRAPVGLRQQQNQQIQHVEFLLQLRDV